MTTSQGALLVSDERIRKMAWDDWHNAPTGIVTRKLTTVRDEYEAERVTLQARIAELEEQNYQLSRMVSLEFAQATEKRASEND